MLLYGPQSLLLLHGLIFDESSCFVQQLSIDCYLFWETCGVSRCYFTYIQKRSLVSFSALLLCGFPDYFKLI